jgi:hypothetical protein
MRISRFIDKQAPFLFVPASQVMQVAEREGAIPYDVPGVELGHHGDRCSFDAFLDKYTLNDPALQTLALIVRGADNDAHKLTPESAGLYATATGFQAIAKDDPRQNDEAVSGVRRSLCGLSGPGSVELTAEGDVTARCSGSEAALR